MCSARWSRTYPGMGVSPTIPKPAAGGQALQAGNPARQMTQHSALSTQHSALVVILAGGSNSRFWPLKGKSLLSLCGRTLIEHQLDAFAEAGCGDAAVVPSPESEAAVRATTGRYGARVTVAVQPEARGMGDALLVAAGALSEEQRRRPWLVTQAHDVVDPEVYRRVLAEAAGSNAPDGGAIVGQEVGAYFPGGYLALHGDRVLARVSKHPPCSGASRVVNLVIRLHAPR